MKVAQRNEVLRSAAKSAIAYCKSTDDKCLSVMHTCLSSLGDIERADVEYFMGCVKGSVICNVMELLFNLDIMMSESLISEMSFSEIMRLRNVHNLYNA